MKNNEFSSGQWNRYIQKFADKYKIKRDNASGEYYIRSKIGEVKLHNITKQQLSFFLYEGHPKIKNVLKRHQLLTCTQEGDEEAIFMFSEDKLDELADVLRLIKRKILSEEGKIHASQNMAKARQKLMEGKENERVLEQAM